MGLDFTVSVSQEIQSHPYCTLKSLIKAFWFPCGNLQHSLFLAKPLLPCMFGEREREILEGTRHLFGMIVYHLQAMPFCHTYISQHLLSNRCHQWLLCYCWQTDTWGWSAIDCYWCVWSKRMKDAVSHVIPFMGSDFSCGKEKAQKNRLPIQV